MVSRPPKHILLVFDSKSAVYASRSCSSRERRCFVRPSTILESKRVSFVDQSMS